MGEREKEKEGGEGTHWAASNQSHKTYFIGIKEAVQEFERKNVCVCGWVEIEECV